MTEETFTGIGKGAINVASQRETLANSSEIARLWAAALIWVGLDAERANGGGDMSTIDPGERL